MEQTLTPIGRGLAYDHTLTKDKHYFAGYFNLAVNNIENVLNNVYSSRFNINRNDIYNLVEDSLDTKLAEPDYVERVEFLKQYFPILHYLDLLPDNPLFAKDKDKVTARRTYLKINFKLLLKAIYNLRNFYTHHYHSPIPFEAELFTLINDVFLCTIVDVKRKKMKNDHTRELLKASLNEEFPLLFEKKKVELKEKKKENRKISLDDDTIKNTIFNDAFGHLIFKPKGSQSEVLSSSCKAELTIPAENGITIAQNSMLFLAGMFLSKKEAKGLRSQLRGFKGNVIKDAPDFPNEKNNSLKFMVTHWVHSYLNVKVVKQKLNTGFSKEALLVQLVDELTKVPDEVYRNLSFEKQQEFVEDINEYIKEGKETDTLENSTVIHPVIRKRYEDKFNYFALRYLDEFADFPSLRFQIHLGNYLHHKQVKTVAGTGYETERHIKEKINVFGKLSEVANLKEHYFIDKEEAKDGLGWELYPNPSYNFTSGNIPVFINLQKSKVPEAGKLFGQIKSHVSTVNKNEEKRAEDKVTKLQMVNLIDPNIEVNKFKDVYIGSPTAMLSLNELPALLYELLVKGTTAEEVENMMVEKLKERFAIIKDYKPGTLTLSQITKNLRNSSSNKTINLPKLVSAINNEIEVSEEKLNFLQSKIEDWSQDRKKKNILKGRELGIEATWLANDLKRFMPLSSREQWKGYMHSQLQNSLAYFSQKPDEAYTLLASVWNFDDEDYLWNQPIKSAFKGTRKFEYFYEEYLEYRLKLYNSLKEQIEGFGNDNKMLTRFIKQQHIENLFYMRLYTVDSTQEQINKLLAKPMVFPRGIFDSKPTFIKGEKVIEKPELFADWYQYIYKNHPFQEFYDYEREYKTYFDKQVETDEDFVKNTKKLDEDAQLSLFKMKEDLKIKSIKGQDLFLKLIAEKLYARIFEEKIELPLNTLYKDRKTRYEIAEKAKLQSTRAEGDMTENIINDSFVWDKTITYHHPNLQDTEVKIKDVNKLKRLLEDEKVKKLFSYDEGRKWQRQEIEDELNIKVTSYETIRRDELLKATHKLEQYILTLNNFDGIHHPSALEQADRDGNMHPNFKCYVANGLLLKKEMITPEEADYLVKLKEKDFDAYNSTIFEQPEILQKAFLLILIRNKFAHNQLPIKEYYHKIADKVEDKEGLSTAGIIFKCLKQIIKELNI